MTGLRQKFDRGGGLNLAPIIEISEFTITGAACTISY